LDIENWILDISLLFIVKLAAYGGIPYASAKENKARDWLPEGHTLLQHGDFLPYVVRMIP
jgi:hypothetical protein